MEGRLLARARARLDDIRSDNRSEENRRRAEIAEKIPEIAGLETALRGIEAHEAFLREIGMPLTLRELGARTEDIPALAAKTKVTNPGDGTTGGVFHMTRADIEAVLRIADR